MLQICLLFEWIWFGKSDIGQVRKQEEMKIVGNHRKLIRSRSYCVNHWMSLSLLFCSVDYIDPSRYTPVKTKLCCTDSIFKWTKNAMMSPGLRTVSFDFIRTDHAEMRLRKAVSRILADLNQQENEPLHLMYLLFEYICRFCVFLLLYEKMR